jgi:biotin-dependent carboxylase-like uncharacterized protein
MTGGDDALEIVRPGLLATIQDLGRPGHARWGLGPSGALDPLALRVSNRLAGNADGAPALEITGSGAEVRFLREALFALAGADLGAALDGVAVGAAAAARARAGSTLAFTARRRGGRAYLAVAGGLEAPAAWGSAATDLAAGVGGPAGLEGRPLPRGARLRAPPGGGPAPPPPERAAALAAILEAAHADPFTPRFVPDEDPDVPAEALAAFARAAFRVSPRSSRAGFRLEGPPLPTRARPDRLSEPVAPGLIQLPPDGLPILLMADRNTTGGYPRLGHLIAADTPKAAQLWPGDAVRFTPVTVEEAHALARLRERALAETD